MAAPRKKTLYDAYPISWQDESASLDRRLGLIADLLGVVEDSPEGLDGQAMRELGAAIRDYLRKREILEHAFFGRILRRVFDDEGEAAAREIRKRLERQS